MAIRSLPNLPAHIHYAVESALDFDDTVIHDHLSLYILGATSPDIRVITKKDRSMYHFVTLDFEEVGDGLRNLLRSRRVSMNSSGLSAPSRAFMAGYVTHLMLDETWITSMFRPYFSTAGVFCDQNEGLIMDRALQLELDRRFWGSVNPYLDSISSCEIDIDIEFLQLEPMDQWRDWVVTSLGRNFSWERLRFMAKRISRGVPNHPVHRLANKFVMDPNLALQELFEQLPQGVMEEFSDRSHLNIKLGLERFLK